MTISNYQIQNVLRTYNKQLRLEKVRNNIKEKGPRVIEDEVHISLDGRRRQIFEQVAAQMKESLIGKKEETP
ncbi:MAG: hypothetical protein JRG73_07605 [Deltaproteobacteria bacterium]|nr:hypothetical protein [Deltaproteobacteria bacterium]MBW2306786.1 hypothetical protein [Deltaproteobacteria bacterium]